MVSSVFAAVPGRSGRLGSVIRVLFSRAGFNLRLVALWKIWSRSDRSRRVDELVWALSLPWSAGL